MKIPWIFFKVMKARKYIFIALALMAASVSAEAPKENDNVFKRGLSAVREFFRGEKSDTVSVADTAVAAEPVEKKSRPQRKKEKTDYGASMTEEEELELLYNSSLERNLSFPLLGRQAENIKGYQQVQARKMVTAGLNIETMRDGEVIIATVYVEDLFLPNDTVLKPNAGKFLKPYVGYLKEKDMYRMLLAMHSDDTGSAAYTDRLTSARVLAILEWFKENAANADYVIPYGMGFSEPLYNNNSIDNRAKNRRLEIYLVPGRLMVEKSSRGELVY